MEWIIGQLNTMGNAFLEYAVPMQIESAILVGLALALEFVLRKTVRASARYWLVTCVLAYVVLIPLFSLCPPLNCLPTGSAAYADPTTHTGTPPAARTASEDPTAAENGPQVSNASGRPEYTRAPLSRPATGQSQTTEAGIGEPPRRLTWPGIVLVAYLAGMTAFGVVLVRRAASAHRYVAGACRANTPMKDILLYCRRRLAVRSPVQLRVAQAGTAPALCGLWSPTILVPCDLTQALGSRHLRAVLLHQLAHVKRCDQWVNMVQNVATVLYFYNPFLWIANRAIRRLRDQAADQTVLDFVSGEHRWYSRRLADVADLTKGSSFRLGLVGVA